MLDLDWWRTWLGGLEDGQVPQRTIADMRADPRFDEALGLALRGVLRLVDSDAEFHRTTQDLESLILATLVVYLDAMGALTHRRLRVVAGLPGVLSASRVSALLMRMRMIGFVEAEAGRPGTAKAYRPTPRLTAALKAWIAQMLDAVELMAPPQARLRRCVEDPETFRVFISILAERIIETISNPQPPEREPALQTLGDIAGWRGGNLVLFSLMDAAAAEAGRFPATGPMQLSVAGLAKRGRVSRTQVLKILRRAEDGGLFTRGDREGEGVVEPALIEAVARFYAEVFINVAVSAHGALSRRAAEGG